MLLIEIRQERQPPDIHFSLRREHAQNAAILHLVDDVCRESGYLLDCLLDGLPGFRILPAFLKPIAVIRAARAWLIMRSK